MLTWVEFTLVKIIPLSKCACHSWIHIYLEEFMMYFTMLLLEADDDRIARFGWPNANRVNWILHDMCMHWTPKAYFPKSAFSALFRGGLFQNGRVWRFSSSQLNSRVTKFALIITCCCKAGYYPFYTFLISLLAARQLSYALRRKGGGGASDAHRNYLERRMGFEVVHELV